MAPPDEQAPEERAPRSVDLEMEVAGTPEEIWEAIATGRGISAWLQARLYGEDRAEVAAREQPAWDEWMRARFPVAPTAG